jgi:HAE1 family hydrophobic/amphiphilic exporter-1
MSIPRVAINRPVTITMITMVIVLLGAISFMRLPVDLMPDTEYPTLTVRTDYTGVGPEEMETLVTRPIEQSLSSVPGVERITGSSSEGSSTVRVSFEWGTNLDEAAAELRTRLDRMRGALPEDASPPTLFKFDVSQFPILYLAIAGDRDPRELRTFVEDQIQYRLERVPGVAAADIRGGLRRQIQVNLDLERLLSYDISVGNVVNVLRRENANEPVGPVPEGEFEILLRSQGEFTSIEPMKNIVIATRGGVPVYLKDVATIEDSFEEVRQAIRVDGSPALRMSIRKQSGANTVTVANEVKAELGRIQRDFPDLIVTPLMDSSEYIQESIDNVSSAAIWGSILAVLVLFLFLRNLRSTLIIGVSIPIAVIGTFALMYFADFTLNTLSFGGLALGVGMLVDNAIVVLENIFRHRESGKPKEQAAVDGSTEVSTAIIASTLTTVAVFVPLVFITGMAGIMFQQLSLVVAFALMCSLGVALTVIPVLCHRFLQVRGPDEEHHPLIYKMVTTSGRMLDTLDSNYQQAISWALDHRRTVLIGTATLFFASLLLIPFIGFELMPEADEGEVDISVEMPSGTRYEITDQVIREIEDIVREMVPEAEHIMAEVGGNGWRSNSSNRGSVEIKLVPLDQRTRSSQEIANALRPHVVLRPGMQAFPRAGGGNWMMRMGGGGESRISVEVRGYDLEMGQEIAQMVETAMQEVEGVVDTRISRRPGVPELRVVLDREKAATLGINVSDIASTLRTAIGGRVATQLRQDGREFEVLVRLKESDRQRLTQMDRIPIITPSGERIAASSVVRLERREGPVNIERKDQERVINISANLEGRDMGSVMMDIQNRVRQLPIPDEFVVLLGDEYIEQQKAFRELLVVLLLAIVLVYAVMASQFESLKDPFLILFSIPMAAIGIILMLFLTDTTFNMQAFIGVIMLAGIVVNNAIVLGDYINILRRQEGLGLRDAVETAGRRRLRPILMTTLTTVLAMVPMALGLGEGGEMQAPMARVVIAGLLTSTLITLILIPTIYTMVEEWLGRRREARVTATKGDSAPSLSPGTRPQTLR